MKLLVCYCLLVVLPLCLAITKFETCRGNGGGILPDRLFVRDCDEAPCDFYNEDIMMAEADFIARKFWE